MRRITRLCKSPGILLQPSAVPRASSSTSRLHDLATVSSRASLRAACSPTSRDNHWRRAYSRSVATKNVVQVAEWDGVEGELEAQIETTLAIPGEVRIAPRPEDVDDPAYIPAETGDDLEVVGGLRGYWEDDGRWDPSLEIPVFGPGAGNEIGDPAMLEVAARRAVVEALAVRDFQAVEDEDIALSLTSAWQRGGAQERTAALGMPITVNEDGSAALDGREGVDAVIWGLANPVPTSEKDTDPVLEAGEARELVKSWDAGWKKVSLADPALKFAVTKRIFQLTGHMIPDAALPGIESVRNLLTVLVKPPKARKLAEVVKADGALTQLPNVAVYDRRVTPIDKDKMIGRWKVIAAELEKRGLPVTGTGKYGKTVETSWADGGLTALKRANHWKKREKWAKGESRRR